MCLILFAWRAHPAYPLVVAANRDEFRARPALPLHWWQDSPDLLAGRDQEAGGTWMGVSRNGRFAALTNYRDPSLRRSDAPSRGALVREALESNADAHATLNALASRSADYVAFNLIVSDGHQLGIHESTTGAVRMLAPGIYGLSNHLLDSAWPKVERARARFAAALDKLPADGDFVELLRDTTPAEDEDLPRTGVSLEWERWLSPAFILAPGYGTRSSSVLSAGHDGQIRFSEWTWDEDGNELGVVTHRFRAEAADTGTPG
ncbi:hypothetical protein CJ010_09810 [Azoarcus sp. DD4]|uniref:NRDE family protein n=1 Tax=Azoarcus sp. DD4 TaxID=2027405 RepID=UPI00112791F6|nr:NRDE family protein [Azoarcus sp. DD4]QDF96803.1 hypothetical protein CJ010_09810 [Azoarcus sp. DD4]